MSGGPSERESAVIESSRLEFLEIIFLKTLGLDSAAQAKNFYVFGCGWWYDREILLLPPLCEYREGKVLKNYTKRDYERDYQAPLPQGRTAAGGCKPRHGRDDRKRERGFSGLSPPPGLRPDELQRGLSVGL